MMKINLVNMFRDCRLFTLKLFVAFTIMVIFGCSYHHTHAVATISIDLVGTDGKYFAAAIKDFSEKEQLAFVDSTREYPSGMKPVLYELTNKDGERVLKVNDLMDGRRFVIAVYKSEKQDWEPLYNACFLFLQKRFPSASIEKKLADTELKGRTKRG